MSELEQILFILVFVFPFAMGLTGGLVAYIVKKKAVCERCVHFSSAIGKLNESSSSMSVWAREINWRLKKLEDKVDAGNLVEIQRMLNQFNEEMFGYIPEHEIEGSDARVGSR